MVLNFGKMGCLMNLKLCFLHNHIDEFPENLGDCNEAHEEHIKEMKKQYQGTWDMNLMTDYCWMLLRECKCKGVKWKVVLFHRSFEEKRTRYNGRNDVDVENFNSATLLTKKHGFHHCFAKYFLFISYFYKIMSFPCWSQQIPSNGFIYCFLPFFTLFFWKKLSMVQSKLSLQIW